MDLSSSESDNENIPQEILERAAYAAMQLIPDSLNPKHYTSVNITRLRCGKKIIKQH